MKSVAITYFANTVTYTYKPGCMTRKYHYCGTTSYIPFEYPILEYCLKYSVKSFIIQSIWGKKTSKNQVFFSFFRQINAIMNSFTLCYSHFSIDTSYININVIDIDWISINRRWFLAFFTWNWCKNGSFLGIRIVRIFGQKYSRFEYLKLFE